MPDLLSLAIWMAATYGTAPLEARLETHLTSYRSMRGERFTATVISPLEWSGVVRIPAGATMEGQVRRAQGVGWGWRRERAGLELQFDGYRLADGRWYPLRAYLRRVDNAREEVSERGRIRGIVAASSPNGLVRGLWGRPSAALAARSPAGLTGLSGRVWSAYALGPVGVAGLMAARVALFRLPEPEIHLPPGAEFRIQVAELPEQAPKFEVERPAGLETPETNELRSQPAEIRRPNGEAVTDVINVAIRGSREQLAAAMLSAGWYPAEPLTKRSFARSWAAFTKNHGYATAPVSRLLYQNRDPDLVFQKSFNSIAKRHHVRLWRMGERDGEIWWVGAATHDIGIAFDASRFSLTHRVDRRIDRERQKLGNDLAFTGCAAALGWVERAEMAESSARRVTDGRISVLGLRDCEASEWARREAAGPKRAGNPVSRFGRRIVLETRDYLFRDNPYYWAVRLATRRRPLEVRSGG